MDSDEEPDWIAIAQELEDEEEVATTVAAASTKRRRTDQPHKVIPVIFSSPIFVS
jgi:hypothetical protein